MCLRVLNLCVACLLPILVSSKPYNQPRILSSNDEIILKSGDNFTVTCEGTTPVVWKWPEVNESNYFPWTTVRSQEVARSKFSSQLFIRNITYPYTGFYKCVNEGREESNNLASRIYIYVQDPKQLYVSSEYTNVDATQYSYVVLPCRPTSPEVNVKLTLYAEDVQVDNATYDPKTGFSFYVGEETDGTLYHCNFIRGDLERGYSVGLKVSPAKTSINRPTLEELDGGHTTEGGTVILRCKSRAPNTVRFSWTTPRGEPNVESLSEPIYGSQNLTINSATLNDSGIYRCFVFESNTSFNFAELNVTIYDKPFISMTEENEIYSISEKAGETVRWTINVQGHPQPTLSWFDNNKQPIPKNRKDKYRIRTSSEALLEIKNITVLDHGNYTLKAKNAFATKELSLFLNVSDKPSVHITGDAFHMVNSNGSVACRVKSNPKPVIRWSVKGCLDESCSFETVNERSSLIKDFDYTSFLEVNSLNSGYVKCLAVNSIGASEDIKPYYVTDVSNGFDIFGFDDGVHLNANDGSVEVAVGEDVRMICGVSVYSYIDLTWNINSKTRKFTSKTKIENNSTKYTKQSTLNLGRVTFNDSGTYVCQAKPKERGDVQQKSMTLIVSELAKPVINGSHLEDLELTLPTSIRLVCYVSGMPKPVITWYKNDEVILPSNTTRINHNNQTIFIKSLEAKDEGTYKCVARNKAGVDEKRVNVKFKNKPESNTLALWIAIGALIVIACIFMLCVVVKAIHERKLERELRAAGLANFRKGAIASLNPDLTIDDQAELLPYDDAWEFPIERLKLGKQLGSGAFGVVMKGVAKGLVEGEESTTVAVKMVKKEAGYAYLKALASELKIMAHLGQHLNVVNLLGACTNNVAKRELLVIVEFCRFGNLQHYLLKHRDRFINQVHPESGGVDYAIGQEELERPYSVSKSPRMKYAALSFRDSRQSHFLVDYRQERSSEEATVAFIGNSDNSDVVLSNGSSVQPEWRSNYRGDYQEDIKPICTKDLLAWAFQVSRGMEYLAFRRVLHGDLAARNILLADNNVVKICDFGLAKSMYKNDNYKKKGNVPLPIKWMAIESISDRVFSTQSDVWSFGVVLWEFFSLAKTPYPGMEADEALFIKLLDGYRMKAPDFAPNEIYKMMLDCWATKPLSRPSFAQLSERIGLILEDSVRNHYLDLNNPYVAINNQRLNQGHDYLALLNPPSFDHFSSGDYINSPVAGSIFSPRTKEYEVFNFEKDGNLEERSPGYANLVVNSSVSNPGYYYSSSNKTGLPLNLKS